MSYFWPFYLKAKINSILLPKLFWPTVRKKCSKGTLSYRLCFKYFSQLFSILDWFRNVYIISSCFEKWWCNRTGQACNLEIILVKTGVRSVWFDNFLSLCKVNYPISMFFINFNHCKKNRKQRDSSVVSWLLN